MLYVNWKNGLIVNLGFFFNFLIFLRVVIFDCCIIGYLLELFVICLIVIYLLRLNLIFFNFKIFVIIFFGIIINFEFVFNELF